VSELVYKERQETFIALFSHIKELQSDACKIYNNGWKQKLDEMHPNINLYANDKFVKGFDNFYSEVQRRNMEYSNIFEGEENEAIWQDRKMRENLDDMVLIQEQDRYIEEHTFSNKQIQEFINSLVKYMRKGLKTKK